MEFRVIATKETILYIEDDPASRQLVERALKHAGYHVLVAERGLDGIDIARRECPDMILTDINLPDISGREITTALRRDVRFSTIPIVALTAQGYGENQALTMAAGVTGYLAKPVDIEMLVERVNFYLHGGHDKIDATVLSDAQTKYMQEIVGRLETQVRELEASNNMLKRLDKMKDSFIEITAHELRTPLTLVYGYSRLLNEIPSIKQTMASDESTRTMIQGLNDGIKRMQTIINEVVTISRIMTNQIDISIGPINPATIVQKIINNLQDTLKARPVNVHFDITTWPTKMRGDNDLITLMMNNLIANAIKYTPDGGHIYLTASADEQNIRISVKDTGIGIAQAELTHVFERFHTAGDTRLHSTSKTAFRGGGLGLGLAVCKAIAEAHGGKIWVESKGFDPETLPGSEFIVQIPAAIAFGSPHRF
jgi:signal transduction histidine kinase